MKNRIWTDTENKIIADNYPDKGVIVTTKILHATGFNDRDYMTTMKQASKLRVKRMSCPKNNRLFLGQKNTKTT